MGGNNASIPDQITDLSAVVLNSNIELLWTPPNYNNASIINYIIESI